MNPLRLLILGALFYLLYRLLFGPSQKPVDRSRQDSGSDDDQRDVLVEDPVCHLYVPQGQAVSTRKDGKTFYFCSDKCCKIFLSGNDTAE